MKIAAKINAKPRHALIGAICLWIIPMAVVGVLVALQPLKRTVTPLYHEAAVNWWAGRDLYKGPGGMNYLPHFAVLFSPFHLLPLIVAELLWRFVAAATLAVGLWKIICAQFGRECEHPFFWASALAMPLCMNALRNGQASAIFAGVILFATVKLAERKWGMAAVLIALSVAIKPLGLVLLLLAPVVYTPLRWRLILAVVGLVIFPFLFGSPHYVVAQLHSALVNLQGCAIVTQHRFADINGIFRTLGAPLPASASRFIRVLAGGLTLAFWWASAIRLAEPSRAMWLHALTASYLMLFNPMTEANSYVILAPALGAWGMFFLVGSGARFARSLGWAIAGTALTMAFLPNLLRPLFGNRFALFWHPLMTLVFIVMLGGFLWRKARQSQPGNLDPDHNQT